jgi:protein-S-isoprenylcysteine O-methyltransferase Ste14
MQQPERRIVMLVLIVIVAFLIVIVAVAEFAPPWIAAAVGILVLFAGLLWLAFYLKGVVDGRYARRAVRARRRAASARRRAASGRAGWR